MTNEPLPIIAVGGFGLGGNSRAARSARAKLQRRDRYGRFAEMGGGFSFKLRLPKLLRARPVSGRVVGASGTDDIEVEVFDVPGLKNGIYAFPSQKGAAAKAVIPVKYLDDKGVDVDGDAEISDDVVVDLSELRLLDAPTGWKKISVNESTGVETYQSEDGYFVRKVPPVGPSDRAQYVLHRADLSDNSLGEKVAEGDSWADIQKAANADAPEYEKVLEGAESPKQEKIKARLEPKTEDVAPEAPDAPKSAAIEQVASELHDAWRAGRKLEDGTYEPRMKDDGAGGQVDIANTDYADLPEKWQAENKASAESAVNAILQNPDADMEELASIVHDQWLERNGSWAPPEQNVPYAELSEEEKQKDRDVVVAAQKALAGQDQKPKATIPTAAETEEPSKQDAPAAGRDRSAEEIRAQNAEIINEIRDIGGFFSPSELSRGERQQFISDNAGATVTNGAAPVRETDKALTDSVEYLKTWTEREIARLEKKLQENDFVGYENPEENRQALADYKQILDFLGDASPEDVARVKQFVVDRLRAGLENDRTRVAVNMSERFWQSFIDDGGEYKTTHKTLSAQSQPGIRADVEAIHGFPRDTPAGLRPSSGYVLWGDRRRDDDSSQLTQVDFSRETGRAGIYGGFQFVLKPEVRERTKVTQGDSLKALGESAPMVGATDDELIRSVINATGDHSGAHGQLFDILGALIIADGTTGLNSPSPGYRGPIDPAFKDGRRVIRGSGYQETLTAGSWDIGDVEEIRVASPLIDSLVTSQLPALKDIDGSELSDVEKVLYFLRDSGEFDDVIDDELLDLLFALPSSQRDDILQSNGIASGPRLLARDLVRRRIVNQVHGINENVKVRFAVDTEKRAKPDSVDPEILRGSRELLKTNLAKVREELVKRAGEKVVEPEAPEPVKAPDVDKPSAPETPEAPELELDTSKASPRGSAIGRSRSGEEIFAENERITDKIRDFGGFFAPSEISRQEQADFVEKYPEASGYKISNSTTAEQIEQIVPALVKSLDEDEKFDERFLSEADTESKRELISRRIEQRRQLRDFLTTSSPDEIGQLIADRMRAGLADSDTRVAVQLPESRWNQLIDSNGVYLTAHETSSPSSDKTARAVYEIATGTTPDTPAELRPASGYVLWGDRRRAVSDAVPAIIEKQVDSGVLKPTIIPYLSTIDPRTTRQYTSNIRTTNVTGPYGNIQLVLKPEVAGRTKVAQGDSFNDGVEPAPMVGATDDELIRSAIASVGGKQQTNLSQKLARTLVPLLLGDGTTLYHSPSGSVDAVSGEKPDSLLSQNSSYQEALIYGAFDFADVESITVPSTFVKARVNETISSLGDQPPQRSTLLHSLYGLQATGKFDDLLSLELLDRLNQLPKNEQESALAGAQNFIRWLQLMSAEESIKNQVSELNPEIDVVFELGSIDDDFVRVKQESLEKYGSKIEAVKAALKRSLDNVFPEKSNKDESEPVKTPDVDNSPEATTRVGTHISMPDVTQPGVGKIAAPDHTPVNPCGPMIGAADGDACAAYEPFIPILEKMIAEGPNAIGSQMTANWIQYVTERASGAKPDEEAEKAVQFLEESGFSEEFLDASKEDAFLQNLGAAVAIFTEAGPQASLGKKDPVSNIEDSVHTDLIPKGRRSLESFYTDMARYYEDPSLLDQEMTPAAAFLRSVASAPTYDGTLIRYLKFGTQIEDPSHPLHQLLAPGQEIDLRPTSWAEESALGDIAISIGMTSSGTLPGKSEWYDDPSKFVPPVKSTTPGPPPLPGEKKPETHEEFVAEYDRLLNSATGIVLSVRGAQALDISALSMMPEEREHVTTNGRYRVASVEKQAFDSSMETSKGKVDRISFATFIELERIDESAEAPEVEEKKFPVLQPPPLPSPARAPEPAPAPEEKKFPVLQPPPPPTPSSRSQKESPEIAPQPTKSASGVIELAPVNIKSISDPSAPGSRDNPIDISSWTKTGAQAGSNPGGFYKSPDGTEYYVKRAKSPLHAENERLASLLYKRLGVDAVEISIGERDGELYTVSPIRKTSGKTLGYGEIDEDVKRQIQAGFAVDAWLANWDVVGLVYDNVILDENGRPVRVDPGGALMWRAQGAPKGGLFGDTVSEIDTLRDEDMNYQSSTIFGDISDDQIRAGVTAIAGMTPEEIDSLVDQVVTSKADRELLKERLKARRQDLMDRFGVGKQRFVAPEEKPVPFEPVKRTDVPETWRGARLFVDHLGVVFADGLSDSDIQAIKAGRLDPPALPLFIPYGGEDNPADDTGEGYYFAESGKRYWGRYGAAGALVRVKDEDGEYRYLLGKRAAWISAGGGKWAYPGGAYKDLQASLAPQGSAYAELEEELGLPISESRTVATHVAAIEPDWKYTTAIAEISPDMMDSVEISDNETSEFEWFTADEIRDLRDDGMLHPSVAKNLEELLALSEESKGYDLSVSRLDDVPSMTEAIRTSVEKPRAIETVFVDGPDIEDLSVRVMTRDASADARPTEDDEEYLDDITESDSVHPVLGFRLTHEAAASLDEVIRESGRWTVITRDQQYIPDRTYDRTTGRFVQPKTIFEGTVLDSSVHKTQTGSTMYAYMDPDGRFYVTATLQPDSKTSMSSISSLTNGVEIEFVQSNPTPEVVAEAMKIAGVRDPRPSTIDDAKKLMESRMLRVLGGVPSRDTVSDQRRARLLEEIANEYGVTPDDVEIRRSESGFVEIMLPESYADEVLRRTKVVSLSHSSSFQSLLGRSSNDTYTVEEAADGLLKMLFQDDGSLSSLKSSITRFPQGLTYKGQSTETDLMSGSGDYAYLGMLEPHQSPGLLSGNGLSQHIAFFVFDARQVLRRVDIWANERDRWGDRTLHNDVLGEMGPGHYEVMVKDQVPMDHVRMVYVRRDVREAILDELRKRGTDKINGVPIELFIAPQGAGLWTEEALASKEAVDAFENEVLKFNSRRGTYPNLKDYAGSVYQDGASIGSLYERLSDYDFSHYIPVARARSKNVLIVKDPDTDTYHTIDIDKRVIKPFLRKDIDVFKENISDYQILGAEDADAAVERIDKELAQIRYEYGNGNLTDIEASQRLGQLAGEGADWSQAYTIMNFQQMIAAKMKMAREAEAEQHGNHDADRAGAESPETEQFKVLRKEILDEADNFHLQPSLQDYAYLQYDSDGTFKYAGMDFWKPTSPIKNDTVIAETPDGSLITFSEDGELTFVDARTGQFRPLETSDLESAEDLEYFGLYGKPTQAKIDQSIGITVEMFNMNRYAYNKGMLSPLAYFNFLKNLAGSELPSTVRSEILADIADIASKVQDGTISFLDDSL